MNFAVIPAAGRSSRLGRNKALLPLGDSLVIDLLVRNLAQGGVERSIVVAAGGDDSLVAHGGRASLEVAVNERPERGMLSSVQVGYRSIKPDLGSTDVILICPVDFPAVQPRTVSSLIGELEHETIAAVPSFDDKRGHPLALAASAAARIPYLSPEIGLRELLTLVPFVEIDVADEGIHQDLDTWSDYTELAGTF